MRALVVAETQENRVSPGTLSMISAAYQCADSVDVLIAHPNPEACLSTFRPRVHALWLHTGPFALAEQWCASVLSLHAEQHYTHILSSSSTFGKALMPKVAAALDVMPITDIIQIHKPDTFSRPIYAGNAIETVESQDDVMVMTLRQSAFPSFEAEGVGEIKTFAHPPQPIDSVSVLGFDAPTSSRVELSQARIVVSGGRGVGEKAHFALIESLADKLGAAVGASRAAVDAGFVPNDYQVGQTGKIVAPELYIAVGISGAIQHVAGMKDAKIIVAINKDEAAPIFEIADYGLVGDLFSILPELQEKL